MTEDIKRPPEHGMQDEMPKFWPDPSAERIAKGMEDYRKANEAQLEAAKLKAFGGGARKAGTPLVGATGLRLLTDYDLPSTESQGWLLKHVIPDTGVGVIYGDSGTFKSFVALDLMAAIATGRERWFGHRVTRAPCIYVPFEGKGGIPKRVQAWRLARLMERVPTAPDAPIFPMNFDVTTGIVFVTDPLNLRNQADRDALVEALKADGLIGGLLCIDTLAQAGGGIDENSSEDMGLMIQAFQDLQNRLGGVTLTTHHTGKDASRGMRGHSSLRGAVDFAIECSRVDGPSKYDAQMRLDKVKDEEAGKVIPFTMQRVTLGVDDDGDFITSLVVVEPHAQDNMPTVQKPTETEKSARDDEFVWNWIRKENEAGGFPSKRSVSSQFKEMQPQLRKDLKRDEVRDAIERLVTKLRVKEEGGGNRGQKWLRALDVVTTPAEATSAPAPTGDKT